MVEVSIEPYRSVFGQHGTQFMIYALWQHYGKPGTDTDNFNMPYFSYSGNDILQSLGGKRERVTTGDNDIPYSPVLAYIG